MLSPAPRRRPALRSPLSARAHLGLALAVVLLAAASTATAERPKIYKWVDSNGIAHYTTDPKRIPKGLRDRIESVDRSRPAPPPQAAAPTPAPPEPEGAAPAPPPGPTVAPPTVSTVRSGDSWFERNALPRAPDSSILASGQATPEQLAVLQAERDALDARIAAVEAEITADEDFLKGLISDPELDDDVPLFDRPDFLEVSRRLPELQARLQELRDERAQLETP